MIVYFATTDGTVKGCASKIYQTEALAKVNVLECRERARKLGIKAQYSVGSADSIIFDRKG